MTGELFDIAVVGGGPAGSTAARLLADRGYNVLLLEARRMPREKTCGGIVSRKTAELLGLDLNPVTEESLNRMVVSYDFTNPVRIELPAFAHSVHRENFDHFLLDKAREAGVHIVEEARVKALTLSEGVVGISSTQGDWRARLLVGADGVHTFVGRTLGIRQNSRYAIALEVRLPVPVGREAEFEGAAYIDYGCVPCGYGWIFGKGDVLNVGVGSFSPDRVSLREQLERYMIHKFPEVDLNEVPVRGYPVPMGGPRTTVQGYRTLLVGDAAGHADPFIGEGIYYAVRSAGICAEVIAHCGPSLEDLRPLGHFERRIDREIRRELRAAYRVSQLFYRFGKHFHRHIFPHPEVSEYFARLVTGETTFRSTFRWLTGHLLRRLVGVS